MKNPTLTDQKIYDLLWKNLSAAYCLTTEEKQDGIEPECRALAGTELYYDEGNEEIRTHEGLFWSEIPDELARRILSDFIFEEAPIRNRYHLCEPDYRDEFPADIFGKCLEQKSLQPAYEQDWFWEARTRAAIEATRDLLEDMGFTQEEAAGLESEYDGLFDDLRFAIEERNKQSPEKQLLLQTTIHGFVHLSSNYDCWVDIWDAGGLWYEESALQGLLAVLSLNPRKVKEEAAKQGVAARGRWPDYPRREGKEIVKYDDFIKSLRECPNYGNWAFFGTFDMQALCDADFDTGKLTIPSGTACGMFNNWNGGGTLHHIDTIRPLPVKTILRRQARYSDGLKVRIDEGNRRDYGYTPCGVYGNHVSEDTFLC